MSANTSQGGGIKRPVYAGARVRRLRAKLGLSQAAMAKAISVSTSYLSQIESGDRPLTPNVLAGIATRYPSDWVEVRPDDEASLLVRVGEACADPSVPAAFGDLADMKRLVRHQPLVAQRLVAFHETHRRSQDQLRLLDEQLANADGAAARLPWDQVRDWFHSQENYIDTIDREAELIAATLESGSPIAALRERLYRRFGVSVEEVDGGHAPLRAFDREDRVLRLDATQPLETSLFSLAYQLGRLEFAGQIDGMAAAAMPSPAGRELLTAGLANYAAGALLMPYIAFRHAASELRHDVDRLRQRFGTSFEQTCHRLSNLQRPGAGGLPVFFCRVDMAGNITKRHSATALQFAQFGGTCPLWIVHEAVAIPDRVLVQLVETPEGNRYVSMAKGLVKPSGSYSRQSRRYAVALGCDESRAADFIYADTLRLDGAPTLIGTSCRICPRTACDQRAFPPTASEFVINPDRRGVIPYDLY